MIRASGYFFPCLRTSTVRGPGFDPQQSPFFLLFFLLRFMIFVSIRDGNIANYSYWVQQLSQRAQTLHLRVGLEVAKPGVVRANVYVGPTPNHPQRGSELAEIIQQ